MNALTPDIRPAAEDVTLRLLNLAQRLVDAERKGRPGEALKVRKKMLVLVWDGLPSAARDTFIACLDWDHGTAFKAVPDLSPALKADAETMMMVVGWRRVCDVLTAEDGVDQKFALSMLAASRRGGWAPSEKQAAYMRRLWDDAMRRIHRRQREDAIHEQTEVVE